MVDLSISRSNLILNVRGVHKLLAFKGSIEIPLAHITEIRHDPDRARGWWHGTRMPGTNIPGLLTAGTFYHNGKRNFWDVHNPKNAVVIDLKDDHYSQVIVEVDHPQMAVELVKGAISGSTR